MSFKCSLCGKEFQRRAILNLHRNSHTQFSYKCKICGKVFSLRYQVQQHQRLHGVYRLPWSRLVPEVLWHFSLLKNQNQPHFSDWPFKCRKCQARFPKASYLSAHLFRVHAIVERGDSKSLHKKSPGFVMGKDQKATCASRPCDISVLSSVRICPSTSTSRFKSEQPRSPLCPPLQPYNGAVTPAKSHKSKTSLESPKKSPGLLAREKVLKKYQRLQVSQPTGRRLCLDTNPYTKKVQSVRRMPKLQEMKVVLHDVGHRHSNGLKVLEVNKGLKTLPQKTVCGEVCEGDEPLELRLSDSSDEDEFVPPLRILKVDKQLKPQQEETVCGKYCEGQEPLTLRLPDSSEEDEPMPHLHSLKVKQLKPQQQETRSCDGQEPLLLRLSDSSDEDESMPHLHRVSSEEKTVDSDGCQSDSELGNNSSVICEKTEGFKERESLFEVLQHEHVKKERSSLSSSQGGKDSVSGGSEPSKCTLVRNGLHLNKKKPVVLPEESPTKGNNSGHRTGIFSMPELMMVSEWRKEDGNDGDMPQLEHAKVSATGPLSANGQAAIPKLKISLKQLQKTLVSKSTKVTDANSGTAHKNNNNHEIEKKVTAEHSVPSVHAHKSSKFSSLAGIHKCDKKCAPPCCCSELLTEVNPGATSGKPAARNKRQDRDASSLMADLSELKHDREDQAEVYPDSLSSMEDLWDGMRQSEKSNLLERRMSCPSSILVDNIPVKRRRLMTVSGGGADERQPCSIARERRRRPKPLSPRCTCCMDHSSGRKKRRQKSGRKAKNFGWSIPEVLTGEQRDYIHNAAILISLRHKVYRLCQVLFPKLARVWQLNPDTEQVDMLVGEITDVTNTVSCIAKSEPSTARKQSGSSDKREMCSHSENSSEIKIETVSVNTKQVQQPCSDEERILCNVKDVSSDCRNENLGSVEGSQTEGSNSCDKVMCKNESVKTKCERTSPLWNETNDRTNCQDSLKNTYSKDLCKTAAEVRELVSPVSGDGNSDEALPVLECFQTATHSPERRVGDSDPGATCPAKPWGVGVLETIQEEVTPDEPHSAPPSEDRPMGGATNTLPSARGPASGKACHVWGNAANSYWENEFMKYIKEHSITGAVGKPEAADSAPEQSVQCPETLNITLLDVQVTLCKDPYSCLTQLRKKVILLLKPLLPNLTFENNFDKFSDDVDMLVELVIQSNETKEARSAVGTGV